MFVLDQYTEYESLSSPQKVMDNRATHPEIAESVLLL